MTSRTEFSRRSLGGGRVKRLLRSKSSVASFLPGLEFLKRGLNSTINLDIVVDSSRSLQCLSSLRLN